MLLASTSVVQVLLLLLLLPALLLLALSLPPVDGDVGFALWTDRPWTVPSALAPAFFNDRMQAVLSSGT